MNSNAMFKEILETHTKWSSILKEFGYIDYRYIIDITNKCNQLNISLDHIENDTVSYNKRIKKFDLKDICIENSWYTNCITLMKRLHKELGWKKQCSICELNEWNNKPIPLEIDHINGNHFDHRLENMRFICPNCHAQTNTYKGKNMNNRNERSLINRPEHLNSIKGKSIKGNKSVNSCKDCGINTQKHSERCVPCYNKTKFKIEWPPYEQLKKEVDESSYRQVSVKYGVSGNAIKKRLKAYEREITVNLSSSCKHA